MGFVYFARISAMDGQVIKEKIMEQMSANAEAAFVSTYDRIAMSGRIEGKIEGKMEQALITAKKLMVEMPTLTDERIALISDAPLKEVEKIRAALAKKKAPAKRKPAKPQQQ